MTAVRRRIPARTAWLALPRRLSTFCVDCGEMRYCAGRRRDRMRCFPCFELAEGRPRRRRRQPAGPDSRDGGRPC